VVVVLAQAGTVGHRNLHGSANFTKQPFTSIFSALSAAVSPLVFRTALILLFLLDVKDSNGALLAAGNSVTLIKDLKVRGSSQTLKRGTLVKSIRLTKPASEIEGRAGGGTMVLKTKFLKKA
jgi:protein PhnA